MDMPLAYHRADDPALGGAAPSPNNPLHAPPRPCCDVGMTTTKNIARPVITGGRAPVVGGTSLPLVPALAASRGVRQS